MNLASAVYGALAVGLASLVAARLSESLRWRARRRAASRLLLHVLVPGDHRRGLHPASADRGRGNARAAGLGRAADHGAAGAVLRHLRAGLRQPPEHGAAAAGLRRLPADAPASGRGRSASPADDGARRWRLPRSGRFSTRGISAGSGRSSSRRRRSPRPRQSSGST